VWLEEEAGGNGRWLQDATHVVMHFPERAIAEAQAAITSYPRVSVRPFGES
jgi:hypothetical protein